MVVAVPLTASLTVEPGERSPFPDFIPQDVWAGLPWYAQLACRLLHERSQGPASSFEDYLQALPYEVDLPACWPRGAVEALQYPYLQQQILDEQQEWERLYNTLRPHLSRRHLTAPDLHWALAAVRSRTFAGPYFPTPPAAKLAAGAAAAAALAAAQAALGSGVSGGDEASLAAAVLPAAAAALGVPAAWQAAEARRATSGEPGTVLYAVCPFIDMFNHDSSAKSECVYAPWRREFRVAAGEACRRGAQLLINYGSQSNDALLQRYGFVQLYGNPHDRYVVQDLLGRLEEALRAGVAGVECGAASRAELAEAAARCGVPAVALEQVPVTAAGFPQQTEQAVAAMLEQLSRRAPASGSSSSSGGGGASTSAATAVRAVLAAACRAELVAAGSSLAEDEAALGQLTAWEAAAAEARAAEAAQERRVLELELGNPASVAAPEGAAAGGELGGGGDVVGGREAVGGDAVAVVEGEEPSPAEADVPPPPPPVLPPEELDIVGGDVGRLRTVLMFRIAKKRVLSGVVSAMAAS